MNGRIPSQCQRPFYFAQSNVSSEFRDLNLALQKNQMITTGFKKKKKLRNNIDHSPKTRGLGSRESILFSSLEWAPCFWKRIQSAPRPPISFLLWLGLVRFAQAFQISSDEGMTDELRPQQRLSGSKAELVVFLHIHGPIEKHQLTFQATF